jgi:hypothetical protein
VTGFEELRDKADEHLAVAERLLAEAERKYDTGPLVSARLHVELAQAYATLALASKGEG